MSRRRRPGTTFATTAAVVAIMAVLLVVFLVKLASTGSVQSQLGSRTYIAGYTRTYAPSIAANGPFLLADLAGKNRPVYLQHLGTDLKQGWFAIQATVGGSRCVVRWRAASHDFVDPCTGTVYPADGTGLVRFATTVLPSNRIEIDLRATAGTGSTVMGTPGP